MSLAVGIHIIVGSIGMTIAIIEYVKNEIRRRKNEKEDEVRRNTFG